MSTTFTVYGSLAFHSRRDSMFGNILLLEQLQRTVSEAIINMPPWRAGETTDRASGIRGVTMIMGHHNCEARFYPTTSLIESQLHAFGKYVESIASETRRLLDQNARERIARITPRAVSELTLRTHEVYCPSKAAAT